MLAQVKENQEFKVAMLSPVIAGRVRLWTDDGSRVWKVDDPEALRDLLGQGGVARTGVEDRRFREVALFDEGSGTLVVPARLVGHPGDEPQEATTESRAFSLQASEEARPPSFDDWLELQQWLAGVVVSATQRGEFALVELGGWDHQPTPYALVIAVHQDDRWVSVVETAPRPPPETPWPASELTAEGASVSAPASRETVAAASILLASAASAWVESPLDLAVTYATSPYGPFSGGEP